MLSRAFPAILFVLVASAVAASALLSWRGEANDRANLVTGEARWIWLTLDLAEERPVRFTASREFRLETPPPAATAKLFIDPRGSLSVNGSKFPPVEQRPGSALRVFDVGPALIAGVNRITIEAESQTGAGGILFSLDLPGGRTIVSDSSWRVRPIGGSSVGKYIPAAVWGRPPMYPWGYPGRSR